MMRRLPRYHLFGVALRTALLPDIGRCGRQVGLLTMHPGGPAPHHNTTNRKDDNGRRNGAYRKRLLRLIFRTHEVVAQLSTVEGIVYRTRPRTGDATSRRNTVIQAVSKCGV